MLTKFTAWTTLGVSLLTVLWSTWPRSIATPAKTTAPFLNHQSSWLDSLLSDASEAELQAQRIALWVSGQDSTHPADQIASLALRHQIGAVWFQDLSRQSLQNHLSLLHRQPGIRQMIGLLPSHALRDVPAVSSGTGLAGLSSVSGLSRYAAVLAEEARDLGIQAIGLPAMTEVFDEEAMSSGQYPVTSLSRQLVSERIHPILVGAEDIESLYLADTMERLALLRPLQAWARVPVSAWVIDAPADQEVSPSIAELVNFVKEYLRFEGLIMVRLGNYATSEELASATEHLLQSGVDQVMMNPHQLALLGNDLGRILHPGAISRKKYQNEVLRVLQAKSWNRLIQPDTAGLGPSPHLIWQQQLLLEQQASLIQTDERPVPVQNLMDRTVHVIGMGMKADYFVNMLRHYFPVSTSAGTHEEPWFALSSSKLVRYDPLILVLGSRMETAQLSSMWVKINDLAGQTPVLVVNLGSPLQVKGAPENVSILQGYDEGKMGQEVAAQMVAGGLGIGGVFPIALNDRLAPGNEEKTESIRLSYGLPESVGLDSRILARIDSIAWEGISELAMPGAQILVAKSGKVIYNRSLGYHTYLQQRGVYPTDLYDIASMTKIVGTTLAAMSMEDQGKIDLEAPISRYFRHPYVWQDSAMIVDTVYLGLHQVQAPVFDSAVLPLIISAGPGHADTTLLPGDSMLITHTYASGKVRVRSRAFEASLRDLLTHHSGLPAGVNLRPFYRGKTTWKRNRAYFSTRKDSLYAIPVARDLYLRNDMADSIWQSILAMHREDSAGYRYSDANMILVQRVIDSINQQSIDEYLHRNWYAPLGLQHTTFRPTGTLSPDRLIPTEYDRRYRSQSLKGYVHDPTAALLGGISGNAGLFSTSNDLAVIAQMWLQEGAYGGKQWVRPSVVRSFIQTQRGHRGLGFDKPPQDGDYLIAPSAGKQSFGHTGFTGTMMWVDPEEELVFIFLSNRVHPRANNWLINQMNIRQRIHEVVYEAIRAGLRGEGGAV